MLPWSDSNKYYRHSLDAEIAGIGAFAEGFGV